MICISIQLSALITKTKVVFYEPSSVNARYNDYIMCNNI